MTNEEAIKALTRHKKEFESDFGWNITTIKALETAMKALEQEPKTGHWIKDTYQIAHCSNCGQIQRTSGHDTTKNCNIHNALYPYCPKCGAKMT